MRPNVLLVVLDACRRDALEPYGAPSGASPAIAQLARSGAALPRVFATGCWTAPSHVSMFTGLLPRAAGLTRAPGGVPHGCRPVLEGHVNRLLPEILRRHGYATAAVSANVWLSETSGFGIGFDAFESLDSGRQAQIRARGARPRLSWALEAMRARVDDGAAAAEKTVRRWIGARPARPFFWFVNLIECHSPYLPPRPYGDLPPLERLRAAEEARRHLTLDAIWRACTGGFDIPPQALDRMRHLYRRSIRYMDDWMARMLEMLDRDKLLDETLVLVTSDHGENLGEGALIAHALSLDNRLIHVPFVAAGPGAPGVQEPVSLAELPRLIAEATGVERHPWAAGDVPPAPVAQLDPPLTADDPRARAAIERWGLPETALGRLTTPLTCATDGRVKVLRRGDREEIYDLSLDPLELAPAPPGRQDARLEEQARRLRQALDHPAAAAMGKEIRAAPRDRPQEQELEELERRMRLLGYM